MRTVKHVESWHKDFSLTEFCDRLGIPAEDRNALHMVYVEVFGMHLSFVRLTPDGSDQWSDHMTKRNFLSKLGLENEKGNLVNIFIYGGNVEVRFIRTTKVNK